MHYEAALKTLAALGPELRTGNAAPAGTPPRKFSLDHIRTLLAELGNPQNTFHSVLIAGTNGKGSTAATLASVCRAAGLRTGLYTSPHLVRVNERMRVSDSNGLEEISDDDFGRLFGKVYTTADRLVSTKALPHTPSFFELLTAVAFAFFAEQRIEIAVLEVGLGGRLDATNVVEPIVSVITDIGIDHTEFLGSTIGEIAAEKAGILRQNGVLVTLSQHPEANAAIGNRAVELNVRGVDASRCLPPRGFYGVFENTRSPLAPSSEPPTFAHASTNDAHARQNANINRNELEGPVPVPLAVPVPFSVSAPSPVPVPPSVPSQDASSRPEREARSGETPVSPNARAEGASQRCNPAQATAPEPSPLGRNRYPISVDGEVIQLDSPLSGHHQQRNLALAVATVLELRANHGFTIPNSAIEAGVRATIWPGRLEWLPARDSTHAPVLLDVAHNPAGAWTLRSALSQLPGDRPRTLLFSCLADKQIEEMARILLPLFDPTSGDPERTRDHIVLAPIANPRAATVEQLLAAAHALDVPAHAAPHLAGALQQARALTPPHGIIVATGSVYLIGELRALLLAELQTRNLDRS